MATIIRPDETLDIANTQISEALSATAGAGRGAIGSAVGAAGRASQQTRVGALSSQVGDLVSRESAAYFEQSKKAHQTAVLSNAITDATGEFMQAQDARLKQVTDKNGNPTFMQLPDDIKKIGTDIMNKVGGKILDPEVANKFRNDFGNYVSNQQILSLKKSRNQQIKFSRDSLDKGLGSLLQQGVIDDIDNLGTYEGQAQQLLDDAFQGGVLSKEDHERFSAQFSVALREGAYQNQIDNDSASASALLASNSAENLGIPEESKSRLDRTLEAKLRSDQIQAKKVETAAKQDLTNQQAVLTETLESRIEADALREDDLLKQEQALPPATFSKLKSKFIKEAEKRAKKNVELQAVSDAISTGQDIAKFKPALVDEHFNRLVETQASVQGQAVSLSQKAQLASSYNGRVRAFAKEMETSLTSSDPQNAVEAISAYTYIRDRQSPALDGNTFTGKAEAVAEMAEMYIERGAMDPREAVNMARERILNPKEDVLKARKTEFRAVESFKTKNINDTVKDAFDLEPFFASNPAVQKDTHVTFRKLAEQAYINTGDAAAAEKIAISQMNRTHGTSEVTVNGKDTFMFAPPEKMYPGLSSSFMKEDLNQFVSELLLPEGIEPESISLFSDDATIGPKGIPTYGVSYRVDGIDIPLVSKETGRLMRWFPDVGAAVQQQEEAKAAAVEAARAEKERLETQTVPATGFGSFGI